MVGVEENRSGSNVEQWMEKKHEREKSERFVVEEE